MYMYIHPTCDTGLSLSSILQGCDWSGDSSVVHNHPHGHRYSLAVHNHTHLPLHLTSTLTSLASIGYACQLNFFLNTEPDIIFCELHYKYMYMVYVRVHVCVYTFALILYHEYE